MRLPCVGEKFMWGDTLVLVVTRLIPPEFRRADDSKEISHRVHEFWGITWEEIIYEGPGSTAFKFIEDPFLVWAREVYKDETAQNRG